MDMKTLDQADVQGKKVLLRVDFNVPLDNGEVAWWEDWRIKATLPTIRYLLERDARVIIMCHLGRPEGKPDSAFSVAPLAKRLATLLQMPVKKLDDCIGEAVQQEINALQPKGIVMLENLRFHPEEEQGGVAFAQELAQLGEVYVDDAFGAVHRAHASISVITQFLPSFAGLLLAREVQELSQAIQNPHEPLAVVMGGIKIKTKEPTIVNILPKAAHIMLGGGLANTLLAARKVAVGASLIDAREVAENKFGFSINDPKILVPLDVTVSTADDGQKPFRETDVTDIHADEMILDIGPKTISAYAQALAGSGTIIWNGNMGKSELPDCSNGTMYIAQAIAQTGATSIVGGGDTVAFISQNGMMDNFSHVSTGGGSMLEFLAGYDLPGIAALQ